MAEIEINMSQKCIFGGGCAFYVSMHTLSLYSSLSEKE